MRYYVNDDNEDGRKKGTGLLENIIKRYDPKLQRDIVAWIPGKSFGIVRKTMAGSRIQFTRYAYENKGGFYDQMPLKANACNDAKISLKSSQACFHDCSQYGGYDSDKGAYFILVDYIEKKKHIRAFRHVPIRLAATIRRHPEQLLQYCRDPKPFGLGLKDPKVLIDKILFNSKFIFDGFPFFITGRQNEGTRIQINHCVQLVLPNEFDKYLKFVYKSVEMGRCASEITKEENIHLYDILLNKNRYTIYNKRPASQLKVLESGFEQFKSLDLLEQCIVIKTL